MRKEAMRISCIVPASPHMVYSAWLDSGQHTAFTGSKATIVPDVGGKFMAGDGYVYGKIMVLDLGRRIVQSWRTTDFPKNHADSRLEIHFESVTDGTRVTILHSEIPEGQAERYRSGWNEFYFGPMRTYFGKMAQIADKTSAARLAQLAAHPWIEEEEEEPPPPKKTAKMLKAEAEAAAKASKRTVPPPPPKFVAKPGSAGKTAPPPPPPPKSAAKSAGKPGKPAPAPPPPPKSAAKPAPKAPAKPAPKPSKPAPKPAPKAPAKPAPKNEKKAPKPAPKPAPKKAPPSKNKKKR